MQTIKGLSELEFSLSKCVLTIGNFDGLHIGHRALISQLIETAKNLKIPSVVLTFEPHPSRILRPQEPVPLLFSPADLQEQLKKMGVDILISEPFTRDFSLMSAEQFLGERIVPKLHPQKLVVGYDFALGRERSGSFETLERLSKKMNFHAAKMSAVVSGGEIVSSSLIRKIISSGGLARAQELLSRPYYLEGLVVQGDGRGEKLGFPTANLDLKSEVLPPTGVYITNTVCEDGVYPSVTNFGYRPTFYDNKRLLAETHVLNIRPNLYGQNIRLELLTCLRPELKFKSAHELILQIKQDVIDAKKYFGI